jgi:hypothetical protein
MSTLTRVNTIQTDQVTRPYFPWTNTLESAVEEPKGIRSYKVIGNAGLIYGDPVQQIVCGSGTCVYSVDVTKPEFAVERAHGFKMLFSEPTQFTDGILIVDLDLPLPSGSHVAARQAVIMNNLAVVSAAPYEMAGFDADGQDGIARHASQDWSSADLVRLFDSVSGRRRKSRKLSVEPDTL